jgi:ABC-type sugar transport system ATPase subunit
MEPLDAIRGVSGRFPGMLPLDRVGFDDRPGEVHVVLSENGAGKSTVAEVLSGAYQPDALTGMVAEAA